jgi:hypothetical protein
MTGASFSWENLPSAGLFSKLLIIWRAFCIDSTIAVSACHHASEDEQQQNTKFD